MISNLIGCGHCRSCNLPSDWLDQYFRVTTKFLQFIIRQRLLFRRLYIDIFWCCMVQSNCQWGLCWKRCYGYITRLWDDNRGYFICYVYVCFTCKNRKMLITCLNNRSIQHTRLVANCDILR